MTAALATEVLPAAVPYCATTFDAFRVGNVGDARRPKWRTYEVSLAGFLLPDVEAAKSAALLASSFDHKDQLIIRETGDRGVQLHVFSIRRKSQPRYVHQDHVTRRVHHLYADPLCVVDGGVLAL